MKSKPSEPVVSEVIGEGDEAHRLVIVGGWSFTVWMAGGADEPRILDTDLAERLGYARPADIRELIERLISAGKLNKSEVFRTLRKTSARGGRPASETWLTEAQALKVAAKSDTVHADKILDEMIRVYMLARRGLLPQQLPDALRRIGALEELMGSTIARVHTPASEAPFIGRDAAKIHIQNPLALALALKFKHIGVADRREDPPEIKKAKEKVRKHLWKRYEDLLRTAIRFPREKGRTWAHLPMSRLGEASLAVNVIEHLIRTELMIPSQLRSKQLSFPEVPDQPEKPGKVH